MAWFCILALRVGTGEFQDVTFEVISSKMALDV